MLQACCPWGLGKVLKSGMLLLCAGFFVLGCSSAPKDTGGGAFSAAQDDAMGLQGSDSGAIEGLRTVNFAYDRSDISIVARGILKENVLWLENNTGQNLQLEGHCDERGSSQYNLSLGQRRAEMVRNYMIELGVAGERLQTISYGKERLLSNGSTEADHAQNRRVNFVPLPR